MKAIRERYHKASRAQKGRILDEAVQVTGYHRKALIRALHCPPRAPCSRRRGRPRRYGPEVAGPLRVLWEALARLLGDPKLLLEELRRTVREGR